MTQRSGAKSEQFSTVPATSSFDTVELGTSSSPTADATYGSSYTQPQAGQDTVDQVKERAGELVDQAQQKTGQVVDQARGVVASRISDQKDRAAGSLGGVAQALRQTGQQLQGGEQAGMTQYVDSAADQIERISSYLQNTDVNEVFDDVEQFARRQPALFLGGAFALGLLGARFLKSSGRSSTRGYPSGSRAYPTGAYRSSYQGNVSGYGGPSSYRETPGTTSYGSGATSYGTGYSSSTTGTTGYNSSTTSYDSDTTGSTTPNVGDTTGARSVGGMEKR